MTAPVATPVAPGTLVPGPTRTPLPYGLFSTFTFRPPTGDRWESGVVWEQLPCDEADAIGGWNCDPDTTVGLPKNLADMSGAMSASASQFTVYGHFNCGPVGWTPADAQQRATDHLLAREEQRVEKAIWTGDLGNVPSLASPSTTVIAGGTAVGHIAALAMLEDFIAAEYGGLGVIHLTRGTALTATANLIQAKGGRLYTQIGTPVVAGGGYPGSGPAGEPSGNGKVWGYVSPALFGYRSDIFNSSDRPGDLLDRARNDLYAIAERSYLLGWDDCGVGAVQFDLNL